MDHIESFQIHLNSKYLSQGTINNAFFYIQTIEVPSDYQLHLSVINASIPYSFYNVNSNNNKLVIYFSESMSTTYLFNTGNYTINQFLTELQSKLVGFTITYDKIKSKLTLAYTTNFTISTTSTCLDILGFGDVSSSLLSSINNTITSINCINLQAFQCICVGTNFISSSISIENQKKPTVICCIPISGNPNSMITYVNPSNYKINIFASMFSMINIKLMDQYSSYTDFSGCHWSMTIQLDIVKFTM